MLLLKFYINKVLYDFQTFYVNYADRYYKYKDIGCKRCGFLNLCY